jgi:urea transporter
MRVFYGEKTYLAGKSGDDLADIKAGLAGYSPVLVSAEGKSKLR